VYIPGINWVLCGAVLVAVIGFGSSSRLAGAYGVAVTATMLVDTLLTFFVIRFGWRYPLLLSLFATGFFAIIDLSFFSATLLKIGDGGWFPLVIGSAIFMLMTTWRRGRRILFERLRAESVPLAPFLKSLFLEPPLRVPGTAVYLTATPESTPHALLHSLKHFKALHSRVVFLSVEFLDVPHAAFEERLTCERLGRECWRVRVRYGFMNRPDVVRALEACGAVGLEIDFMDTSFFLSRQTIVPVPGRGGMAFWRERLFTAMARNAGSVTDFFNIPANRAVELGTRVEI